jgi:hydrogenase nickel incorporation protein HypB
MAELLAAGAKPKKRRLNCGVIAGDVAGNDDCIRFQRRGLRAVNVNTGKECHLDAHMIQHALEEFNLDEIDVLFIENVGNLVCPVDFPLGTDKRIVVISVTEGDDMVRKHPLIFALADAIVINKIDLAEVMEVDPEVIKSDAERIRSDAKVVLTDAKHGEGITDLMNLIDL